MKTSLAVRQIILHFCNWYNQGQKSDSGNKFNLILIMKRAIMISATGTIKARNQIVVTCLT